MAALRVPGLTERERSILKECRKEMLVGGLSWGITSLFPLWAAFRVKLLPAPTAPAFYTVAFVVFSLLGCRSKNRKCIDKILDMEDSQLAEKIRKTLPPQAKRYDKLKTAQEPEIVKGTDQNLHSSKYSASSVHRENSTPVLGMQEDINKGALHRNKYGDFVYNDK